MRRHTTLFSKLRWYYKLIFSKAEKVLYPFLDLAMRFWMGHIFFKAGYAKCGNWESTLFLFTNEHPVPYLPPPFAAFLCIVTELGASVFLMAGLLTRLSCLVLLAITIVIQSTYMDLELHYFWAFILSVILLKGPSLLSPDYWVDQWAEKKYPFYRG